MKFSQRILPAAAASLALMLLPAAADEGHDHKSESENARAANTVVLDATGVKNLRIETVEVDEADFEESFFSLGRIEAIPAKRSSVSSRIAGRITALRFSLGDTVERGAEVAQIESRQPGDPPPTIALRAPADGLVTRSTAALGDPVEPENALMEITDLSEVYAVARVPEHQAAGMKPGTTAHIRVAALPEAALEGELLRFGTEADRESGTIDAIFRVPNASLALRPGMRAEFSIVLGRREGVMSVPRVALQGDAANRFLYVRDSDPKMKNAFIKTPVVVGQMNDSTVEIVSGLLPADEVVTRGAYSLAFAGGGSISLKAALDAAHGHEHNADGSELTADQKKAKDGEHAAAGAGGASDGGASLPWKISTGVLLVLLIVATIRRKSPAAEAAEPRRTNPTTEEL